MTADHLTAHQRQEGLVFLQGQAGATGRSVGSVDPGAALERPRPLRLGGRHRHRRAHRPGDRHRHRDSHPLRPARPGLPCVDARLLGPRRTTRELTHDVFPRFCKRAAGLRARHDFCRREFLYLATVIDLASRRLAGWAIADHMRTDLVTDALAAAEPHPRQPRRSDHAHRPRSPVHQPGLRRRLPPAGVRQSMSAVGSSADNALAESFNATFKRETLQGRKSLVQRARGPPRRVPLAPPLQHPTPTLPPRTPQPDRLRDNHQNNINYAGTSRITRVQNPGQGPQPPHQSYRSPTPTPRPAPRDDGHARLRRRSRGPAHRRAGQNCSSVP